MIWGGINFGTGGELDSLNEAREDCDKMAKKYAPKIFEKHVSTPLLKCMF